MALNQYEEGRRQERALTTLERTDYSTSAVFRKADSAWKLETIRSTNTLNYRNHAP
ncbi:hypothetical protein H6F86_17185 [Phormidium sp. FACHB-592]|uniref:Uncharacterized protein n=1 Tax=Stenomitos frigidus AS-A4 TaxID=2933935 RepID=A0ABV0KV50_9CYAN|nr:hypothetical protein [Phormidium sp. FACHB-592]MBD2075597.1 hypothetical protein [Phormidium sp. FACHB-592]